MKEIFNIASLNPAKFQNRSGTFYAMCGRVEIQYENSTLTATAHVVNEDRWYFYLYFTTNNTGRCRKPISRVFENINVSSRYRSYNFQNSTKRIVGRRGRAFRVTDYKPVRVLFLLTNCDMRIMTNRFVYTQEGINRTIQKLFSLNILNITVVIAVYLFIISVAVLAFLLVLLFLFFSFLFAFFSSLLSFTLEYFFFFSPTFSFLFPQVKRSNNFGMICSKKLSFQFVTFCVSSWIRDLVFPCHAL